MLMTRACQQLALEQNRRLFASAYELDHAAFALLEDVGLDAFDFDHYQGLRRKAAERYQEAIEHLALIEGNRPSPK
ncbi:hypothetical protein ACIQSO_13865 [Pseudomonas putida]|uniref:hypothetical protein n=1 Tax=Pseudomonas putida TaxID=303 RepID=UPI00383BC38C